VGREISIYLNDALFNAGVLGFYRLYADKKNEFRHSDNQIIFDSEILNDFTDRYLDKLQEQFRHETVYGQVSNLYNKTLKKGDNYDTDLKEFIEKVKKFEMASYKSGYEIIKKRGCTYDFLAMIKELPKIKDLEEQQKALDDFAINMKAHKDIFILKGIAYTKVNAYWESVSFFHRDAVQAEFTESVQKYFTDPAINFIPAEGKKATMNCCQCGVGLIKKDSGAMSWIKDMGIDIARKTSPFWNYNVDICTCPVCNLIYSCMPLGFTILRDEGIFINGGKDLYALESLNAEAELKKQVRQEEAASKNILYGMMSKLVNAYQQLSDKNMLGNIQVVRRNTNGYTFDVVSAEILKRVSRCSKELDFIAGNWLIMDQLSIDIYNETTGRILKGRNLYSFIHELLHYAHSNNKRFSYIYQLIVIQSLVYTDEKKLGGLKSMSYDKEKEIIKIVKGARVEGEKLNLEMSRDTQNSNKIRGLSFKLLNQLKTRDARGYVDTMLRQYMGLGKAVPKFVSEMLKDENIFLDCGYAFVAGLQGAHRNESTNDTNEKEGGQEYDK